MVENNNPEKFSDSFDKDDDDENESDVFSSKKSKSRSINPSKKTSGSETEQDSGVDSTVQKKRPIFPIEKEDVEASIDIDKKSEKVQEVEKDSVAEELEDKEVLSAEEEKDAVLVIVDHLTEQAISELEESENDSSEEYQAIASAAFLEELRERVEDQEELTAELTNGALREVLEDFGILEDDLENTKEDGADNDIGDDQEREVVEGDQNTEQEDKEEPKRPSQYLNISQSPIRSQGVPNSPVPLVGPPSPPPVGSQGPVVRPSINPNIPPFAPVPNPNAQVLSPNAEPTVNTIRRHRSSGLLVGGIVGYIIGGSGSRERAKRRLNPAISELEKRIGEMHDEISKKEERVRDLARKNYQFTKNAVTKEKLVEVRKRKKEVRAENLRRIELEENHKIEKLGKFSLPAMKMYVERRLMDGTEKNEGRKSVEQMTVTDLLKHADKIIIGNLSIKQYFERKKLDEKSLREIVKKYLRGGDYEKTFWEELLPDIHKKRDNQEKQLSNPEKGQHQPGSLRDTPESNQDIDTESPTSILEGKNSMKENTIVSKKASKPNRKQVSGGIVVVIIVVIILLVLALILNT